MSVQSSTSPSLSTTCLDVHNLCVGYQRESILNNLNLIVPAQKMVGIIGPNGAGKSTFIKSCFGLIHPQKGKIKIFDRPACKQLEVMSYVPQISEIDWHFPIHVLDVVLMGRQQHIKHYHPFIAQHHKDIAHKCLEQVGLADMKDRQISTLSGGQRQRMFIARSLAQGAQVIFLDEPFAGVDAKSEKIIIELLRNLIQEGKTIFCVHHDLSTAQDYFDDIFFINRHYTSYGPAAHMLTPENIAKLYHTNPTQSR